MMEEVHHTEHIPQWKKDEVEEIKSLIKSYPLFGLIGIEGIPAKQLQSMRRDLKDIAVLKVSRNTLVKRALDESGEDVQRMVDHIDVQTALIFTDQNPFKLYKLLEQSKSPAPIKAGAIAPRDIIVEKGPTSFPPGPILSDMQGAGIPAAIDKGSVVIKETKTVAKEGERVSQKLAVMLARLEIFPMEVGLNLNAVYESGLIFTPDVLVIDEAKYFSDFTVAIQHAFNLSVNAAYPTSATIGTLISKAVSESRNVGINATVFEPELMGTLIGKANSQMLSVASVASSNNEDAVDDGLKAVLGAAATTAAVIETAAAEEPVEEEKEEEAEESGMAGLGALFG
ncbi:MAG: 50S ribosomal protein L10 [Methanosarcinaceae archaeon]|nr:50S ribosomal protein L10 [Methanosarcinaceae archaeon]MDF1532994.1 50S ribosomal protein L10 [Methanosarcinaceae archaeon]